MLFLGIGPSLGGLAGSNRGMRAGHGGEAAVVLNDIPGTEGPIGG